MLIPLCDSIKEGYWVSVLGRKSGIAHVCFSQCAVHVIDIPFFFKSAVALDGDFCCVSVGLLAGSCFLRIAPDESLATGSIVLPDP